MGLLHTPRTLFSVAKGSLKKWRNGGPSNIGIGASNPHVYTARAGLVDLDYLGHMNNAAYLNHAEYSRWELAAENGMMDVFMKHKAGYLLGSNVVRYRQEIKPGRFEVHSAFVSIDDRSVWTKHDFRHVDRQDNKIRAQVLAKGMFAQGRSIVNPRDFLVDTCGIDSELVEQMILNEDSMEYNEIKAMTELEVAQRASASTADEAMLETAKLL